MTNNINTIQSPGTALITFAHMSDSALLDTNDMMNCRKVCVLFRDVVDASLGKNLTDAREARAKAIGEFDSVKANTLKTLKNRLVQPNILVRNLQYYMPSYFPSESEQDAIKKNIQSIEKNDTWNLILSKDPIVQQFVQASNNKNATQIKLENTFRRVVSLHRIKGLLGGSDAFPKLPELKIDKSHVGGDYIDQIPFTMLTAKIMRGVDPYGRPFIVIRAQEITTSQKTAQVFFQRYANDGDWSDATVQPSTKSKDEKGNTIFDCTPWGILSIGGYVIEEGHPRIAPKTVFRPGGDIAVPGGFAQLAELIKNNGNDRYKLV